MLFRVGHDVRYEIIVDAPNAKEAEKNAEDFPYEEWVFRYTSNEDVAIKQAWHIAAVASRPNPAI